MGFLHLIASVESVEGSGSERCTICPCQSNLAPDFRLSCLVGRVELGGQAVCAQSWSRCTDFTSVNTLLCPFLLSFSADAEASWGGWSGEANFLGGSDGGNVADGVGVKCIALRTPTERAAMADAPRCDG